MEKWNGKILPYKPHPLFTYETSMLREFNMIVFMNKKQIIIDPYNGKQIGEIVDGEFIEDEKKASE
ncbi:MAG: hypothetical protein HC836_31670 [Richelia sp. RM2_1_2]|nr:hypothetical protein [Richelia sp. RM2_1_2]